MNAQYLSVGLQLEYFVIARVVSSLNHSEQGTRLVLCPLRRRSSFVEDDCVDVLLIFAFEYIDTSDFLFWVEEKRGIEDLPSAESRGLAPVTHSQSQRPDGTSNVVVDLAQLAIDELGQRDQSEVTWTRPSEWV